MELGQSKYLVPSGQSDAFDRHEKSEHLTGVSVGHDNSVAQFFKVETQLLSGQRYLLYGFEQVAVYPLGF